MIRFKDIKISLKLKIGFAVIILLMLIGGIVTFIVLNQLTNSIIYTSSLSGTMHNFRDKEINHLDWRHSLRNAVEDGNIEKLRKIEREASNCPLGVWLKTEERRRLAETIPSLSPLFAQLEPLHNRIHEQADKIYRLFESNDKNAKAKSAHIFKNEVLPETAKLRSLLYDITQEIKKVSDAQNEKALNTANRLINLIAILVVLAVIIAVAVSMFVLKSITEPIEAALKITTAISEGDISEFKAPDNKDETGQLLSAIGKMTSVLNSYAISAQKIASGDLSVKVEPLSEKDVFGNAFKNMTDKLREQVAQINELTSLIASASAEIMASATQIASSAIETSASITETSTTVEEVRQTAMVSSTKAQNVSEASKKATDVSLAGTSAVEETIKHMNDIKEQMDTIADSIVKLSEQTHNIAEIIATVNDIAEQSNLLAVNASIEAAKAGEYGKGFAVVATEVRSLAEQSKQATAQVRAILSDIQKATSRAVLVTEQGGKAVSAGVKQSTEAGASIKALSKSIHEAAQSAAQIAVSNQQQLAGMDQIVIAMENIKQASLQNAESIKQVELATKNLNDMMQRLKTIADRYKI